MVKRVDNNKLSSINGKSKVLVISGTNIIDVINRVTHKNSTIVCRDGKICEIGPASSVSVPENAKVIELSGRYIIPGLIDAHVHLAHPGVDDYGRISTKSMTKKYFTILT